MTTQARNIVIAVDGPSGSGKSSTSRGVATRLGLRYLDTGAMFRAMTWWMLEQGVDVHDPEAIARRCIAMAAGEPIEDINGDPLTLRPDSICVHGDTPGAVEIARQVRGALEGAGVPLAPFALAG